MAGFKDFPVKGASWFSAKTLKQKAIIVAICFVVLMIFAAIGKNADEKNASSSEQPLLAQSDDTPISSNSEASTAESADPKDVGLNPQKYAGELLTSRMKNMGSGEHGEAFAALFGGYTLTLKCPSTDLYHRLAKVDDMAGQFGSIHVTYRVDATPSKKNGDSIGEIIGVEP